MNWAFSAVSLLYLRTHVNTSSSEKRLMHCITACTSIITARYTVQEVREDKTRRDEMRWDEMLCLKIWILIVSRAVNRVFNSPPAISAPLCAVQFILCAKFPTCARRGKAWNGMASKKIRRIKFSPRVAYESESQNADRADLSSRVESSRRGNERRRSSHLFSSVLCGARLDSSPRHRRQRRRPLSLHINSRVESSRAERMERNGMEWGGRRWRAAAETSNRIASHRPVRLDLTRLESNRLESTRLGRSRNRTAPRSRRRCGASGRRATGEERRAMDGRERVESSRDEKRSEVKTGARLVCGFGLERKEEGARAEPPIRVRQYIYS